MRRKALVDLLGGETIVIPGTHSSMGLTITRGDCYLAHIAAGASASDADAAAFGPMARACGNDAHPRAYEICRAIATGELVDLSGFLDQHPAEGMSR